MRRERFAWWSHDNDSAFYAFISEYLRATCPRSCAKFDRNRLPISSTLRAERFIDYLFFFSFLFDVVISSRDAVSGSERWNFVDIDRQLHRGKYRDSCSQRVERKAIRGTFGVINKRGQVEKCKRCLVSTRGNDVQPRLSKPTSLFSCMTVRPN